MSSVIMNHMRTLAEQEEMIRNAGIEDEPEIIEEEHEEERNEVECNQCGCVIDAEEAILYDGDPYCEDCMTTCEYCGQSVPTDETVISNLEDRYEVERVACESCAEDHFYRCDCCGSWISDGGVWAHDDYRAVCNRCADHYTVCADCEEILHNDDAYYCDRDGETYCASCYNSHNRSGNISSYGHDQFRKSYYADEFKEMPDECGVSRYFGVELEVDGGRSKDDLADDLFDEIDDASELFKCKTDGSLGDEGLEIVTFPCSLRFMMEQYPFEDIAGIALRHKYTSHDAGTCGLHIHVSRDGLGETDMEQDLTVAKLMILFDRFWEKLVRFSRRDYEQISSWCKKPDLCFNEEYDDDNDIVCKSKEYKGRYQAINITNSQTIEFRLFRGTLKVSTIKASIQFVNCMIDFVMQHSLRDCMKTGWGEIFADTSYPELAEYLKVRGL